MPVLFGEIPEAELDSSHTRGTVEVNVSRMPAEERGVRLDTFFLVYSLPSLSNVPSLHASVDMPALHLILAYLTSSSPLHACKTLFEPS